eukprot:UN10346
MFFSLSLLPLGSKETFCSSSFICHSNFVNKTHTRVIRFYESFAPEYIKRLTAFISLALN